MKFAAKLRIAQTVCAILILSLLSLIAKTVSYHYCHGANHNAHGAYCQAVYQSDYTALK